MLQDTLQRALRGTALGRVLVLVVAAAAMAAGLGGDRTLAAAERRPHQPTGVGRLPHFLVSAAGGAA